MEDIKEVELYYNSDDFKINQVCVTLKQNDIPFVCKSTGSGGVMNIYFGSNLQEKVILVSSNDYNKALELISPFVENMAENSAYMDEVPEELKNVEDIDVKKDISSKLNLVAICLLFGIPLLAIIIITIFSNFN